MPRSRSHEDSTAPDLSPTFSSPPEAPDLPTPEPGPSEDLPTSPLFGPSSDPIPSQPLPSYDSLSDPRSEPDDDSGSLPPSIGSTPKARARALLPTFRRGLRTIGSTANQLLTVEGSAEHAYDLYVPDDEDVEAIAVPLAGLASRRVPAEAANPDVTDLIGLAMGIIGYAVKQLRKRALIHATYPGGIEHEPEAADADPASPDA
ncbi:hypothetical protein F9L07_19910 [Pimelobacter simplex]|uniref:Uncharacterized protein n=1 Tax=Nocardioides simplex TaxID=2045 RepID=A0A7J5DVF1_NOCSI|nr:hypothetical protein [Pimelobacter simplex]KAB2809308.1 hypothetical protein F9L07_19910 [Pimelobacter simplex]